MALGRKINTPPQAIDLRQVSTKPRKATSRRWSIIFAIIGAAMIIGLAIWGTLFYLASTGQTGKTAMQRASEKVGRLMMLPQGEEPTYGTVADKTKLTNQKFFAKAENGDEVLFYSKAQLAVLYRPSINKIVNVGPLVSGNSGSPYVTSRIAIANGTNDDALLDKMTQLVTQTFPNARIVSKGKASRIYPTSIAIDVTKKDQPLAEQIADSLKIKGGKQPAGEPEPGADIFIIIGEDYR